MGSPLLHLRGCSAAAAPHRRVAGGAAPRRARSRAAPRLPHATPPESDRAGATAPVADRASSSNSSNGTAAAAAVNGLGAPTLGTHLECVSTGMDVMCMVEPDDPGTEAGGKQQQLQPQPAGGGGGAAVAAAEVSTTQQLLSLAFLIAPFFLWGTTMAAMRVRQGRRLPPLMSLSCRRPPSRGGFL
jgi:hypothetical protein